MTEAEKKALYDKKYAESLEWHKNEFDMYDGHLKIPLKERWEILEHFKSIFAIMKKCGVCRFDGEEPMSNVSDFLVKFKKKGDPDSLDDLLISNRESCWTSVMFEQTAEEIEAAAKSSARMEVDLAEWREKKEAEDAEKRRREEEERKARQKAEEDWRAKCGEDQEGFLNSAKARRERIDGWFDGVAAELDKIRRGDMHWYADDHLNAAELKAVKDYASALFAFTDAQNEGMTGFGLYHQNETRAAAHEAMLEAFGLDGNEYARHATKSYDFSDDYDHKTQTYKHLPEDAVVNMLGYALLESRKT